MIGTDHAAAIAGPHGIMVRYHGTARWTTIPGDDADLLIEASFVQDGTVRPLMAWTGHEPIALAQLITAGTN